MQKRQLKTLLNFLKPDVVQMNFAIAVDVQRTVKVENVFKFKSLILQGSLEKFRELFV